MPIMKTLTIGGTTYDLEGGVTSVNGQTGAVVLDASDVGAATEQDIADAIIQVLPVDSASGSIASFPDGYPAPVEALSVAIEPVQDLHGQTSPYPAGGGKNLLNLVDGTYTYPSGLTVTISNGAMKVTGTTTMASGRTKRLSDPFLLKAGTYIMSPTPGTPYIRGYLNRASDDGVVGNYSGTAFTTTQDETVYYGINVETGQTYNTTIKPQLEAGSTMTSWSPYSNICPITGWSEAKVTRSGVNIFDGVVEAGDYSAGVKHANTDRTRSANKIPVKPGMVIKICSATYRTWLMIWCYAADETYINNTSATIPSAGYANFTVPDGVYYVTWSTAGGNPVSGWTNDKLIFNCGTDSTAYSPYSAQTVTIDLSGTRYGGTLDVLTGVLTVTQEAHVLNGSDGWINEVSAGTSADGASYIGYINKSGKGISTASGMFAMSSAYKFIQNSGNVSNLHKGEFNGSGSYFRFVLQDGITTLDQLNIWLSSNPVTLVYELATPISVQLTAADLSTLLGQNNVWANCGDVAVSYRADIQRYIEKKLS